MFSSAGGAGAAGSGHGARRLEAGARRGRRVRTGPNLKATCIFFSQFAYECTESIRVEVELTKVRFALKLSSSAGGAGAAGAGHGASRLEAGARRGRRVRTGPGRALPRHPRSSNRPQRPRDNLTANCTFIKSTPSRMNSAFVLKLTEERCNLLLG